jgi:excisionase family DNA binding protein
VKHVRVDTVGGEADGATRVEGLVVMPANTNDPEHPGLAQVRFLTVAEVATLMRVSKMTVYRLVHNGELPAVRVGKSFRVPEKAVNDYLRSAYFDAG